MSTIYDFDEMNWFDEIDSHYHNQEEVIDLLNEGGCTVIEEVNVTNDNGEIISAVTGEFRDELVPMVEDVFKGDNISLIVVKTTEDDTITFTIFKMSSKEFLDNWSEKVWAKFRQDNYTTTCMHCGERMAYVASSRLLSDIGRINQYHCENCHYTWIGYPNGEFIRAGVLHDIPL